MRTINRTAITIITKKPYIDWINSFEGTTGNEDPQATTILIPDEYDEIDYEVYLEKTFKTIFEDQLESWTADRNEWPSKRTYKIFRKWFDVYCSDIIWDFGDDEIEHEEEI
nr:hypothetical protein [uncultured Desulfobacter sp.]